MSPAVDRISNLPTNVIEMILMHVPIKDAVQTSILSRKWRYQWNTIPQLEFNEKRVLPKGSAKTVTDGKRVEVIDQVLLLHRGPIHKFKLSNYLERCGDIDRWVLFVSRKGIKEFTLNKWRGELYKVPACLYMCQEITYLELYRCTIVLPPSFEGFCSLTTLDLQYVNFSNNELQILMSTCPLLKKVVLKNINGVDRLSISALKLVYLEVSNFEDLYFENTPLLTVVSIILRIGMNQVVSNGEICRLVQIFSDLPRIEELELCGGTLLIFSQGDVPTKLLTACHLKYLSLELNFKDKQQMLAALCIFRSSPLLQKLCVKASSYNSPTRIFPRDFWDVQETIDCSFSGLQTIEVIDFIGTSFELKFVEFVLANAPVLVKVQIELKHEKTEGMVNILTEMIKFPRISSKAQIFFQS